MRTSDLDNYIERLEHQVAQLRQENDELRKENARLTYAAVQESERSYSRTVRALLAAPDARALAAALDDKCMLIRLTPNAPSM
jgi:cell division septum initiation protein DivIVA